MEKVLLFCTLACEGLAAILSTASIARPQWGIWPPVRPRSGSGLLMWALFFGAGGGVVALGIMDRGSLSLPPWVRLLMGAPLWGVGNGLALWSMVVPGLAPSFGGGGPLVRHGPYRYSRNPQYVGLILGLLGWAILSGSILTLVAALAGVLPLILAPFAEEQWLRDRHGPIYEEYAQAVPRFVTLGRNQTRV
jgi:protein-S-isoprenylcysteine O-methyltransferase Ste14